MNKIKNYLGIIFFNSLFIFLGFISIELILKIRESEPLIVTQKYPIKNLNCNLKIKYDVSSLYGDSKNLFSTYERGKNCYRSYSPNKKIPIILVIGGSTSAQTFLSEGETFQDILDSKFNKKFDFVNGGVDGQSTVGHSFSINFWHSKALDKTKIKEIIFYIGINDHDKHLNRDKLKVDFSTKDYLKNFLQKNSRIYFYAKKFTRNSSQNPKVREYLVNHRPNPSEEQFFDSENIIKLDPKIIDIYYEEHISKFITKSLKFFPFSSIRVIQQQVPGCKFLSKYEVIDRHNYSSDLNPMNVGTCESLGYTYLQMDRAMSRIPIKLRSRLSIEKMYLEEIIKDDDVYDAIHTNKEGSKKIAEYIEKLYK